MSEAYGAEHIVCFEALPAVLASFPTLTMRWMTLIMRMSRIHSLALITVLSLVWGCDMTTDQTGAIPELPPGSMPAGSGDVNVRTPGTPGANDPDDVNIDLDVNRDDLPAVSSTPRITTPPPSTLRERREDRRERLGDTIDRIDLQVEANGADVNVD